MRVLRSSGVIRAARDPIFALLEDPNMADRLNPELLRVKVVESAWMPSVGARTKTHVAHRGVSVELETEIAEYRRGHFLLERQVSGPFVSYERAVSLEDVTLEDDANGGTQMTEILVYAVRLGWLGRAFDRLALKRDLEQVLEHRRARLHELLVS